MKYIKLDETTQGLSKATDLTKDSIELLFDKQTWKKELFTNPEVKGRNILCMFKISKKNEQIKHLITTAHFINRKLMLGHRTCIIISHLLKLFNLAFRINIIIVRKDIGTTNYAIADYSWKDSKFGMGVHIISLDQLLADLNKDLRRVESSKEGYKIFIFQDFSWSELILAFKLKNITISGGEVVRRHALNFNQIILSEFVILLGLVNNYFIDKRGIILHKKYKANQVFEPELLKNHSKELYGVSFLDFRDERFKEIMRTKIDMQNKNLETILNQFEEFLIDREDYLKYKESLINKTESVNKTECIETDSLICNKTNTSSSLYYNGKKLSFSTQKREYHSTTHNTQSIEVSEKSEITKINKSNHIFSYLESIEQIINESDLAPNEAQHLIESSWINMLGDKLSDPNYFVKSHSYALINSIKTANKILNILSENNQIKKRFPFIYQDLNNIEHLMLTFTVVLTYYSRLGHTNICSILGNQILYQIFKKNLKKIKENNLKSKGCKPLIIEDSTSLISHLQVELNKDNTLTFEQYKTALNQEGTDIIKIRRLFYIDLFTISLKLI